MTFLEELDDLHESQCLEFKEAGVSLPDDLWETYSAFANTEGGEIVLGVHEGQDKAFTICGVTDPHHLEKMFWDTVRDSRKVERDVMLPDGVEIIDVAGKSLVVIHVPRAERTSKPVCVYDKHAKSFVAYIRRGESDIRCNDDDLRLFYYDSIPLADKRPLDDFEMDALCGETITHYRRLFSSLRPDHPWSKDSTEDFLFHIGAVAKGRGDMLRPTLAGLVAFGNEYEIVNYLPHYFLDYREESDSGLRWDDRVTSSSGDWSGNLFDFYMRVINKVDKVLKNPFGVAPGGAYHVSGDVVMDAVHEVIANALIHAYYGMQSTIRVVVGPDSVVVTNSGSFLIDRNVAIEGGVSDPRNPTLMRIFSMVGISDRMGSGLCTVYGTWREVMGRNPELIETHAPAEVRMTLPLLLKDSYSEAAKIDDRTILILCEKGREVTSSDVAEFFGSKPRTAQKHLNRLCEQGVLSRRKVGKTFAYRLAKDGLD